MVSEKPRPTKENHMTHMCVCSNESMLTESANASVLYAEKKVILHENARGIEETSQEQRCWIIWTYQMT